MYKVVSNIMLRLMYDHYVLIFFIIEKVMVTLVYFPLRTILNGKMEGLSRNPIRSQLKSELYTCVQLSVMKLNVNL